MLEPAALAAAAAAAAASTAAIAAAAAIAAKPVTLFAGVSSKAATPSATFLAFVAAALAATPAALAATSRPPGLRGHSEARGRSAGPGSARDSPCRSVGHRVRGQVRQCRRRRRLQAARPRPFGEGEFRMVQRHRADLDGRAWLLR